MERRNVISFDHLICGSCGGAGSALDTTGICPCGSTDIINMTKLGLTAYTHLDLIRRIASLVAINATVDLAEHRNAVIEAAKRVNGIYESNGFSRRTFIHALDEQRRCIRVLAEAEEAR